MLTTSRRLACVSSLLARSPRWMHRIRRRVSASASCSPRSAASSIRCGGEVALLDQLGQPALVVTRQQVDLADLPQVHPHAVGRQALGARRGPLDPAPAAPAEQVLVGVVGLPLGDPRRVGRRVVGLVGDVGLVDGLVEGDAGVAEGVGDRVEHVAGQLDVAQDVGHLLGVDAALLAAAVDQRPPLGGVDAVHHGRLDGAVRRTGRRPSPLGDRHVPPLARSSIRRWSQPSNHSAASADAIELPSASRCNRASASSADQLRITGPGPLGELPPHGRGDQVAGLGLGIDVEVGDRRPLEHLACLGVGRLDGHGQDPAGVGEGEERPAVGVVVEQLLDQPAGDRLPVLGQQGDGDELGVLPDRRAPWRGDGDRRAPRALLGDAHQVARPAGRPRRRPARRRACARWGPDAR